eukprot:10770-Heterococcus_DN1.PRE.2
MRTTLPPALAGLAMALSSVSVVISSLALRLYTAPRTARRLDKRYTVVNTSGSSTAAASDDTVLRYDSVSISFVNSIGENTAVYFEAIV